MQLIDYTLIQHLIPENSFYSPQQHNSYADEKVWFHDGDFEFLSPLDLDNVTELFGGETSDYSPLFIMITGNAVLGNVFNNETDGSTGLIVTGQLHADNIVVGGQEVYVAGDVKVADLYWGDYNHGSLVVTGQLSSRVLLTTDYKADISGKTNTFFWLDDENEVYFDAEHIKAIFREEFIHNPFELEDELYSWKQWLKEALVIKALQNKRPLLLEEWKTELLPKEEKIPPYFADKAVSYNNLKRFAESTILLQVVENEEEGFKLEYWDETIFRRVYKPKDEPENIVVYLQMDDSFVCMVYAYSQHLYKVYRDLPDGEWVVLNEKSPEKYVRFLEEQWNFFQQEFALMHYWWNRFITTVTPVKVQEILSLPIIQKRFNQHSAEGNAVTFASFEWFFWPKIKKDDLYPRVSIAFYGAPEPEYYHYDLNTPDAVQLLTQYKDGRNADEYDVLISEHQKVKNAVLYFERLEKNISSMDNYRLSSADIEVEVDVALLKRDLYLLAQLCIHNKHLPLIETLLDDLFSEEMSGDTDALGEMIWFCEDNNIPFCVQMDWKADAGEVSYFLMQIVKENFGIEMDLNEVSLTVKNKSLEKGLKKYDVVLRKYGLQLGLANDFSDLYIYFVHQTRDAERIRGLFAHTRYEYEEAKDM